MADEKDNAVEEITETESIEDTATEEEIEEAETENTDGKSEDEVTVEEACAIVHRQAMWVKKKCRETLEGEGNARKDGGHWLIKRARLEELSNEIEVYNMTMDQATKKFGFTEDELNQLIEDGNVKAQETEDGLRISKKSLNYYQKANAETVTS